MMRRELCVTIRVAHPFPCPHAPHIVAAVFSDNLTKWTATATAHCECGLTDVLDVAVKETRRQVKAP